MERAKKLARLYLLEEKVAQTIERITAGRLEREALREKNRELADRMRELKRENRQLSDRIRELESEKEKVGKTSLDKEEIRKRIDRVLEKFGELQL